MKRSFMLLITLCALPCFVLICFYSLISVMLILSFFSVFYPAVGEFFFGRWGSGYCWMGSFTDSASHWFVSVQCWGDFRDPDKQNQPERQKQPGTNTTQITAATCTTIKTDGLMVKELRQKLASFTNLYGFSNACIYHMQQIICIKRNNSPQNCIC